MAGAIHAFDQAVALQPLPPAASGALRWRGATSPDYANMVGPYGGITAAQALQAVMLHPGRLGEPIAFTGNFAAALADGQYIAEARPARTNRSTQHWLVSLLQADAQGQEQAVFTATVVTAVRRQTWGATDATMPPVPPATSLPRFEVTGKMPPWFGRYDVRWLSGAMPFQWDGQEHPGSETRLWVRDEPPRSLDFPGLAALCDVFYPRVWLRRAHPTPVGTITFTVYFHVDAAALAAGSNGHLLAQARGQRFFNGYFDQSGELWSAGGQLLATTHQMVYFKE